MREFKNTSAVNREAIQSYRSEREKRQANFGRRFALAVICGMLLLACFGLAIYDMCKSSSIASTRRAPESQLNRLDRDQTDSIKLN
jgi:hypothetical protein